MRISERRLFSWEVRHQPERSPIYTVTDPHRYFIGPGESTILLKMSHKHSHKFTIWEKTFIASIYKQVHDPKWYGATWKQYYRFNVLAKLPYENQR